MIVGPANDFWLDPGMTDVEAISGLLKPYYGPMRSFPVLTRVNNTQNDYAGLFVCQYKSKRLFYRAAFELTLRDYPIALQTPPLHAI